MDWVSIIINIITLLLGGGVGVLVSVKATRRKAEAEAEREKAEAQKSLDSVWTDRLEQLREEVKFERECNHELNERNKELIQRMQDKEDRFQDQTMLVRRLNAELLETTKAKGLVELELGLKRCEIHTCPWREPPNAHTPPHPHLDKEEWHRERLSKLEQ